jgi:hypothetical protein
MKPGYLRYGGLLLLSAILGGCAASPPAQNTARLAPLSPTTRPMAQFMLSDMVRGSDIGLTRGVVAVDIPAGHKLMVLYRIYHNQQLDEKNPLAYFIYFPAKGGRGKYNVELSLFDPDLINPQPTDQIRLMPPSPGRWLTVKDKHAGKWMGFSLTSSLMS